MAEHPMRVKKLGGMQIHYHQVSNFKRLKGD